MKNQIDVGLGVAEAFMQKRLLAVSGSQLGQNVATMQRRVLSDAKAKGFDADLERMHNIGYVDLPKLGRLTAPDIAEVSEWCYKVLSLNPNYSNPAPIMCFFLIPALITVLSVAPVSFLFPPRYQIFSQLRGVVFIVCPLLAGEGVLFGLRGEQRSLACASFLP